ncbi:MAG: toprim domain-containing protein [Candidatus Paceibacterota bacterium]
MRTKDKLVSLFMKFPGIGSRQAERFVYFLLRTHPTFIEELVVNLQNLKSTMIKCESCHSYFEGVSNYCATCSDKNADSSLLMIVAKDIDMEAVKKASLYEGKYFVLGGLLSLRNTDESEPYLHSLSSLVEKRAREEGLKEIIIALSANPEGDHTGDEIRRYLIPLSKKHGFTITTLGRGLSTGTELEYSDADTIKAAMENRR